MLRFDKLWHFFSIPLIWQKFSLFSLILVDFPRHIFGLIIIKIFFKNYISCFCVLWTFQNWSKHFFEWTLGDFRNKKENIKNSKKMIFLLDNQSYQLLEATNPLKIIFRKYFIHYWSPLMLYLMKNYFLTKNMACQKVTFFHSWAHCASAIIN